jgi:hypothetical protein
MLPIIPALVLSMATPAPPTVEELAPYLKMLCAQAGSPGRVACRDADMAMALKKEGVSLDARSGVAWASSSAQARAFAQDGKFVVVGEEQLLADGASLALTREGGRILLLLHRKNSQATGVPLSDALLKLARMM